jgi:hypothetical protein
VGPRHRKLLVVATTVEEVRLVYEDRLVAWHLRSLDRERTFFEPIHYSALLERKPGGIDHALPGPDPLHNDSLFSKSP